MPRTKVILAFENRKDKMRQLGHLENKLLKVHEFLIKMINDFWNNLARKFNILFVATHWKNSTRFYIRIKYHSAILIIL